MNYDKIKRSGILFLLGIGAITSLSCNDNDNGGIRNGYRPACR